jgi:hypothetical protein
MFYKHEANEDEYLRVFINPDDRVNSYNGVFISKGNV